MLPTALEGVRVVDLTHHIAGPYSTKLLADYGADVVKVERPEGGDATRRLGPFFHDVPNIEGSGLFLHLNTNKKSLTLNLHAEAGRKIVRELIKDADILVESFRPGFLPSLGLGYEELEKINPRLVMTSISNFGQTGPYRDYKMSEITMYALGGTMYSTGDQDREPVKLALTAEQFFAGMIAATATLGACLGAMAHGAGQHIDLSLMEIMAGNQDRAVQSHTNYQYTGAVGVRAGGGASRNILPSGVYPCADGYVQLFALQPVWDRVCLMIDRPDLINDPYFTAPENFTGNPITKAEFDAILLEWLLERPKQEIMEKAQSVGYFCGAINSIDEVFEDKHLQAREYFVEVDHPYTGPLRYPGAQFKMSETPMQPGRAPLLGEHTTQVLKGLGYTVEDIVRLREQGAI